MTTGKALCSQDRLTISRIRIELAQPHYAFHSSPVVYVRGCEDFRWS